MMLGLTSLTGWLGWLVRRRFSAHLDNLESELRRPEPAQGPRTDLPPEVAALAARLGARSDGQAGFVHFEQSGQMWLTPGAKPVPFTAGQTARVAAPGFLWRARVGATVVADYLTSGTSGLEAKLYGFWSVARMVGGAEARRGESLRYLSELAWNPDAILVNRALEWTVLGPRILKVATGQGEERSEITFDLDSSGLISSASARARPYLDKGRTSSRPWRGRFWDYQSMGGRLLPVRGEVAWMLDAGEFLYWQGQLLSWSSSGATVDGSTPCQAGPSPAI